MDWFSPHPSWLGIETFEYLYLHFGYFGLAKKWKCLLEMPGPKKLKEGGIRLVPRYYCRPNWGPGPKTTPNLEFFYLARLAVSVQFAIVFLVLFV